MSVRHLFGALQWVTTGSVVGRPQEVEGHYKLYNLPGVPDGCEHTTASVRPMEVLRQSGGSLEGLEGVKYDFATLMNGVPEGVSQEGVIVPVQNTGNQSNVGHNGVCNDEQFMLQCKLKQFDQLSDKIVGEMARYRKLGDRRRLNEMEKELQVVRILRGSALRCLKDSLEKGSKRADPSDEKKTDAVSMLPPSNASLSGSTSPLTDSASCNHTDEGCASTEKPSDSVVVRDELLRTPVSVLPTLQTTATAAESTEDRHSPPPPVPLIPENQEPCKVDLRRNSDGPFGADQTLDATSLGRRVPQRPVSATADVKGGRQGINRAGSFGAMSMNSLGNAGGDPGMTVSLAGGISSTVQPPVRPQSGVKGALGSCQVPVPADMQQRRRGSQSKGLKATCPEFRSRNVVTESSRDEARRASTTAAQTDGIAGSSLRSLPLGKRSPSPLPFHEAINRLRNLGPRDDEDVGLTSASVGSLNVPIAGKLDGAASKTQAIALLRKRGNELVKKGQYQEAIQVYTDAIRCDPENNVLLCNRAVAYLLNNQYKLSLMDCENVLYSSPCNLKAHWRAAKALLYMNRTKEARYHYSKARELSTELADGRLIAEELEVVQLVEMYYNFSREQHWSKCLWYAKQLLHTSSHVSPISLPWHCMRLEALLHLDPLKALDGVRQLQKSHPTCAEVLFLHAKSLFYCSHNQRSIAEALAFVRAAREQKKAEGEAEDGRYVALERDLTLFERCRDRGNAAYKNGSWEEAYDAYSSCISIDPQNTSLVAMAYYNRAAACMQIGRWAEALGDIDDSIRINSTSAKAYTRRAHINIHLFSEGGGVDLRLLKRAVSDLRAVVKLEPSKANRQHLEEIVRMVQEKEKQLQYTYSDTGNRYGFGGHRHDWRGEGHRGCSSSPGAQRRAEEPGHQKSSTAASPQKRAHHARLLGLEPAASLNEQTLVRGYHKAALQWHPDRWVGAAKSEQQVAEQKFKEVSVAYQALKRTISGC